MQDRAPWFLIWPRYVRTYVSPCHLTISDKGDRISLVHKLCKLRMALNSACIIIHGSCDIHRPAPTRVTYILHLCSKTYCLFPKQAHSGLCILYVRTYVPSSQGRLPRCSASFPEGCSLDHSSAAPRGWP